MELYSSGNSQFALNNYEEANKYYTECIGQVKNWAEVAEGILDRVYLKALCNRGYCNLKLRNYSNAVEDISLSIEIILAIMNVNSQESAVAALYEKSLLRRALCYEYMTEFKKALSDIETLISMNGSLLQDKAVSDLFNRLRALVRKDKIVALAEPRPDYLINSAQRLRLSFLVDPPSHISEDSMLSCKVCIGNEFGLFQRSYFKAGGGSREKILLDLSDNNQDNKKEDLPTSALISVGTLGCELIVLDYQDKEIVKFAAKYRDATWNIGQDGKASISLMLAFEDCDLSKQTPVAVLLRFFVLEHSLYSGLNSSILDVISLPILIKYRKNPECIMGKIKELAVQKLASDIQASCIRRIAIPVAIAFSPNNNHVYAFESAGLLGIGGKIWDSSFALIQYLAFYSSTLITGKNVLELGSGTGVTGLSLAQFAPGKMIVTDLAAIVPLMKANIQLNLAVQSALAVADALEHSYDAVEHSWGSELSHDLVSVDWDTVIAADVVYSPEFYEPLYQSIRRLLLAKSKKERECIIAHRHRHAENKLFFQMIESDSSLVMREVEWMTECGNVMSNVDIKIFRIKAAKDL